MQIYSNPLFNFWIFSLELFPFQAIPHGKVLKTPVRRNLSCGEGSVTWRHISTVKIGSLGRYWEIYRRIFLSSLLTLELWQLHFPTPYQGWYGIALSQNRDWARWQFCNLPGLVPKQVNFCNVYLIFVFNKINGLRKRIIKPLFTKLIQCCFRDVQQAVEDKIGSLKETIIRLLMDKW